MYVSVSEDEPNLIPVRIPSAEPPVLKNALISSAFDKTPYIISSHEDSFSTTDAKQSSSEGTSSLIASTFKDADKLLKK